LVMGEGLLTEPCFASVKDLSERQG